MPLSCGRRLEKIRYTTFLIGVLSIVLIGPVGHAQNAVPSVGSLSPNIATVGGGGLVLNVSGNGFVNGSVVRWNGADRSTTFMSSSQLLASIPNTDLATAALIPIT